MRPTSPHLSRWRLLSAEPRLTSSLPMLKLLVVVDTLRGGAAVFIACLGVAWVLVFLSRLLAWPWWQLAQERARLQALSTASPLQILYDHANPQGRYARNLGSAFKYWVG